MLYSSRVTCEYNLLELVDLYFVVKLLKNTLFVKVPEDNFRFRLAIEIFSKMSPGNNSILNLKKIDPSVIEIILETQE